MRVVVIGGAGFIGRHVTGRLLAAGHSVHTLDRRAPAELLPEESHAVVDMAAQGAPESAAARCGSVDAIVWLAASITQQTNVSGRAEEDLAVMVEAPLRFLHAVSGAPRAFVHASSIQVYGRPFGLPVDESHPTDPFTAYGAAKLCAEQYLDVACAARDIAACHLRLAFVYGPGQHTGNVIPHFLADLRAGQMPTVHGAGNDVRDDVHVDDVARAFVLAVERAPSGCFNVASGRPHTLLELAQAACRVAGLDASAVRHDDRKSSWIDRSYATAAARDAFGFEAEVSFDDGLSLTWQSLLQSPESGEPR